jgi:broad specificity phosphatase PhoE
VTLPVVYLARHGETEWSLSGQHTGMTDLPLTPLGCRNAQRLGRRLADLSIASVFCSPLLRARSTCEQAGFKQRAVIDPDLVEWNYGDYEGLTSPQIHQSRPDWFLFRDGCPGGESVADIQLRADRVLRRLREVTGDVLLFSSGHFLRVLAARWLGLDASAGQYFMLTTATLSTLGYEHDFGDPVIRLWNDARHVGD